MKKGFTLAEVLITLAIIGVVAAMTIPTLINNYNKRIVEVRLQKTYAEFSQAFKLAEANYGDPASWNYIDNDKIDDFLNKYLLSHIKYSKYCEKNNLEECFEVPIESASGLYGFTNAAIQTNQRAIMLNNGASIFFQSGFESGSPHIHVVIDVNGPKQGANLLGKDIFSMIFILKVSGIPVESGYAIGKKTVLGFYMYGNDSSPAFSREEMLELCKEENPRMCSALIQNDGWKIKEDYPWYK